MANLFTTFDDVIVQEGVFAYSFESSGAISGGSLVKMAGPMQITTATDSTDNCVGVAAATCAKNIFVGVYGPGNIVRACAASSIAVGAELTCALAGRVDDTIAPAATMFIGFVKEVIDRINPKKRLFDWMDIVADLIGLGSVTLIYIFSFLL